MSRTEKLARLRAARSGAKVDDYHSDNDENLNIYDEVDENQYRKHKRDRVLNDDFIVDDNGEGYAETGADDWEAQNAAAYGSEDEDVDAEENGNGRKQPKKLRKVKMIKDSNGGAASKGIDSFFKQPAVSFEKKQQMKKKDNDPSILNDILSDFTSKATSSLKKKQTAINKHVINTSTPAAKKARNLSATNTHSFDSTSPSAKRSNDTRTIMHDETSFYTAPQFDESVPLETPSSPIRTSETAAKNLNILDALDDVSMDISGGADDVEANDFDDDDDEDDDIIISKRKKVSAVIDRKMKAVDSSPLKNAKQLDIESSPSKASNVSNLSNITFEKLEGNDVVMKDEDGDEGIQMFWLDYIELDNSLLLFGKIKTTDGRLVSGMVQVNGLCKTLYFLPRAKKPVNDDDDDDNDDEEQVDDDPEKPCSPMDVYDEIIPLLMDKYGLDSIKAKPQHMKYAFEHHDIPKEAEYLKVLLPYKTPKSKGVSIPANLTGETFAAVFGTNTSIFESFVMQRQIMGPCWLTVTGCDFSSLQNVSHCNIELSVSSPNDISPDLYTRDPPPSLNVLSLNVQSYMNAKTGRQEVGSVSLALYKSLPQDVPISPELQPTEQITLVRPVGGTMNLPVGLKGLAEKKGMALRILNNEKTLLNCLVGMIKKYDPDVFFGHRLENVTLDILLHRMKDLNINQWSNMGRRSRKVFPEKFSRSNGRYNLFLIRDMLAGRLLCDISNDMGQSLTPKCQSWELAEMYEVVCRDKYSPMEVNLANPLVAEDANKLLAAINENAQAVRIIAKTAFGMQILTTSKQLTNIAGNAWSHTLGGTRAGRNEYILLHEFERENYIVPDRETRAQRQKQANGETEENGDEGNDESNTVSNKKAKFQGGLVFEPEKGLHKNYILVMDFNSLYPSIIQEFNICFTTIERSNLGEDELPKVPTKSAMGVLPKLLQQLVTRRREVKSLMKDPKLSAIEKAQLDIKQMALKVTANSMYGCLGYVNSRFYAKPLAMLVTNKGREILLDTRQLAESSGLTVVYGDTDSVMIDTRCDSFAEAIKIGNGFKEKVNERYKLLEIDIDNVFKRLLLHSKKKYAALNCSINEQNEEVTSLEVKGLDMKRREYCPLSKELSIFVLNNILHSSDPQEALNEIYEKLEEVTAEFDENAIPMVKLRINTKLSKDPSKYPGGKSMPSVQVALRLQNQGKIIKAGSVITFVITTGDPDGDSKDLEGSAASVAERARALTEVLNSNYKPDKKYYSEKQLFNPIDRLLTRVEGYDVVRLAQSLGLEAHRYEAKARDIVQQHELQPLESTIPDSTRFRDMKDLKLCCTNCSSEFLFGGIQPSADYQMTFSGIKCKQCEHNLHPLSIAAQLELFIRTELSIYYQCWLVCDDCGIQTRQVSVYGKRCIGANGTAHECKGVMRIKYSDKMIYNQLLYLQTLFDIEKTKQQQLKPLPSDKPLPVTLNKGEIDALAEQNRKQFSLLRKVVQKYLDVNGRRYVDLASIFRVN
ncbi:hypothetical protein PICMEDRAFT_34630 [Pichia membranifaciens NRRL Y-2026]|uniref:DNA polymerase n=1 Tax=Pichia membranifaciens NRRL Y-2026 TaxID=763406 RepID=A0A1E3NHX3_9ASCO|nr:hypothetical protein PICMEDRAFT_34630 [Pichia membranifaciens NRRL Y-2026]ODQ45732.1 hypothetical protein PICMEDRAFT_34630 [Pichia membranifaciens NRRL Y-2026]